MVIILTHKLCSTDLVELQNSKCKIVVKGILDWPSKGRKSIRAYFVVNKIKPI